MPDLRDLASGESLIGLFAFGIAGLIPVTYAVTGEWPAHLGGWGIPLFVVIGLLLVVDDLRESIASRLPIDR